MLRANVSLREFISKIICLNYTRCLYLITKIWYTYLLLYYLRNSITIDDVIAIEKYNRVASCARFNDFEVFLSGIRTGYKAKTYLQRNAAFETTREIFDEIISRWCRGGGEREGRRKSAGDAG